MKSLEKIIRNSWVQHGLFWFFSFYILWRLFAYSKDVEWVDVIYTFLFHLSIVFVVYVNLRLLIPHYLQKKRFFVYFSFLGSLILMGIGVNMLTFNWLADIVFPGYYFIDYYSFSDILEFIAAYLFLTSLLKFSKSWFRQLETQQKISLLETEKLDAEIGALKAQVNPHFLFNSLNNLYSLSLDNDKRTPGIILRLSEMMRYLLYETNVEKVSLGKEIEHLDNFIEMQELRVGEGADIRFVKKGNTDGINVAPLLFLPLVENGFKHGIKGNTEGAFIHISLHVTDEEIEFKLENKKGEVDEMLNKKNSGVGLENLRRRLELIYPEKHRLDITDGIQVFAATLKINLL